MFTKHEFSTFSTELTFCNYIQIITDPHEILLFSVCIKSTIVVFQMKKQLSEENGGGPFCQQGNNQG